MSALRPLQGLDLNLLVVLRALLRERSVTRAAQALNSTQPTVSRALKTLRVAFSDPLLVRSGGAMALTAKAIELQTPVERALSALDQLTELGAFDSNTAKRHFRVVMPDIVGLPVLNRVAKTLEKSKGVRLTILGSERFALRGLLNDTVDLVYGGGVLNHPELVSQPVGAPLKMAVVFGHKLGLKAHEMSAEAWLAASHVQLVPGEQPSVPSAFDRALRAAGHRRRVQMFVSYLGAIGEMVENTHFVASLPTTAAAVVSRGRLIHTAPHPMAHLLRENLRLRLTWHQSHHHDTGHRWLRDLILNTATKSSEKVL